MKFKDPAPVLPDATGTRVPDEPELASKNTASDVVGTDAPPEPPDVVDHLLPAVPFQTSGAIDEMSQAEDTG